MPDARRAKCKGCGQRREVVGELSWRGFCGVCGPAKAIAAASDLHHHQGPFFRTWREQMAASVGAVLLEPVDTTPERR